MTKRFSFALLIGLCLCQALQSDPAESFLSLPSSKVHGTLSFDTSYFESNYNNPQVRQFGLELMQAQTFLTDQLLAFSYKDASLQAGERLLSVILNFWIAEAYTVAYHELGHATRFRAVGCRPDFFNTGSSWQKIGPNFFSLFLSKLKHPLLINLGSGAMTTQGSLAFGPNSINGDSWNEGPRSRRIRSLILVAAAGVNNEMYFAEHLADQAFETGGHWTYFPPYVLGKLSAALYSMDSAHGDLGLAGERYRLLGYHITKNAINRMNLISLLASANTYVLASSYGNFLLNGESKPLKAWAPYGIRLPDTSGYLTSHGISYRVATGYKINKQWILDIAFEKVMQGESQSEITIGFTHKASYWANAVIKAAIICGVGTSFEGSLMVPVAKHLRVGGGISHYDARTLIGERNISSLKNGRTAEVYWARVSFAY